MSTAGPSDAALHSSGVSSLSADQAAMLGTLLTELVDDAALFPPGDAPMAEAVPAHLRHDAGRHSGLLGRFLCPVSRIAELRVTLPEDADLRLGLIADTGVDRLVAAFDALDGDDRFILETAEIRHPGDRLAELEALLPYGVEAYIEVAPADTKPLLATLAGHELLRAKLRTGGLTPEAFPAPDEVADFLVAAADLGLGLKCTAGLHHAVRHTDAETGFTHHGFLNVLAAAALASDGADTAAVAGMLATTEPDEVAAVIRALTIEDAARTRDFFHGFGSCSFTDPVEDLLRLGLLPRFS